MGSMRIFTVFILFCATLASAPTSLRAQDGWNEARVLELVQSARAARARVIEDDSLRTYSADARGYVYFYLDRRDTDETTLVKTDQIALEVYWKAPDSTKQRIVGMRDEESLPTRIQYHLDHLTVVQDDYADVIRLGDGDEVSAVAHPMARGSEGVYDFRLADSISISLGGDRAPIRVYEVDVRPRDFTQPGFVGSVFLDRTSGAIVRMNFTFTSASYVDSYLDYIRISLDNSLWDGRYWLPYEQRVELRREVPYLDFPAGSVIRGRYEIRNYRFNEELGPFVFLGGRVSTVPAAQRESFAFEEGLFAQIDEDGLSPVPELAEIRAEAARMAGRHLLSGLGRWRPWVPNASWASRSNRAEGSAVGLGASYRLRDDVRVASALGYTFGRERPYGIFKVERSGGVGLALVGQWNALGEIGGRQTVSSTLNSVAVAFANRDYLDPYFSTGARLELRHTPGVMEWTGSVELREDRSGSPITLERLVRPITEGTVAEVRAGASTRAPLGPGASAELRTGRIDGRTYALAEASGRWKLESIEQGVALSASLGGGWGSTDAPLQTRALLGGRGTLLGYPYRAYAGDRWVLLHLEGSQEVAAPWLRLGVFGSAGSTWLRGTSVPEVWGVSQTGQARFSAGITAQTMWDLIRIDLGRGLNGGKWEAQLSLTRRFWWL